MKGVRNYLFSLLLLHCRLTILESLNIFGSNLVFCTSAGNKMHTNQDNVWERSKHIATDTEPPTEGGVPIMLFNAVLTDDSMFHNESLGSKTLVARATGANMDENREFSFPTLTSSQFFSINPSILMDSIHITIQSSWKGAASRRTALYVKENNKMKTAPKYV